MVIALELNPGKKYRLLPPTTVDHVPAHKKASVQAILDKLSKGSHELIQLRKYGYHSKASDTLYFKNTDTGVIMYVYMDDLPYGIAQKFRELTVENTVRKKARNQALRNIFNRRGFSAEPGVGPANTVRAFMGNTIKSHKAKGLRPSRPNNEGYNWNKNNRGHWTRRRNRNTSNNEV
jgi:hypothetical protein